MRGGEAGGGGGGGDVDFIGSSLRIFELFGQINADALANTGWAEFLGVRGRTTTLLKR